MLQESGKHPCAICYLSGVSSKSSFCVACSSWVLKRCNVISGTLKPDPIFKGKRCNGLARPVDNQWQRSRREGRRLRWCHPSATLGTDYPQVAAVNSLVAITRRLVSWGQFNESMPSAHPNLPVISHHLLRKTLHLHASGTCVSTSFDLHNLQSNDRAIIRCVQCHHY